MNKYVAAFLMILAAGSANAQIPMPDSLNFVVEKVEGYMEKASEFKEEVVSTVQENINQVTAVTDIAKEGIDKGKSAYEKGKDLAEKGKSAYELAKDPKAAGTQLMSGLSSAVNSNDFENNLEEKYVFPEDITSEQYQEKMDMFNELKRNMAANMYASAFVRRNELLDDAEEEAKSKPATINNMKEAVDAQGPRIRSIIRRLNYIVSTEAQIYNFYLIADSEKYGSKDKEEE